MKLLFEIDKKNYIAGGEVFSRPSARAIIIRNEKIAVIYSRKNCYYKIPGGGIENREDYIIAMMREVKEEMGLTVIPDSVREFGYVHRIEKGKHEPIFVQDNFYYFCEVEDKQSDTAYSENEKKEDFIPMWVEISDVIKANKKYLENNAWNTMIEREVRVLEMIV